MNKKNICMFLMTEFTHDARVTKEAKTLVQAGHKVTVIALKSKETNEFEKKDGFLIQRIKVYSRYLLPKRPVFFFIKYLEFIFHIVRKLWRKPFDVYHAHDLETLPIGFILSRIKNKPLIYDSHELYVEQDNLSNMLKKVWYRIEKFLAPKTTQNIIVNESLAEIFAQRYHISLPIVIRNCQYLNISEKKNLLRNLLPIADDDKIIIYQGQIALRRGIDKLIEAMKYVEKKVLVLLGSGDYKQIVLEKIKQDQHKNKVFFLDTVPWKILADYTASADLGIILAQNVCMNVYFSLPNKLFEYLSAGLPVVCSNFPEFKKIVVNDGVGLAVDPTNPHAIAEAINKILDDPILYQQMSENAKKAVTEKYNWELEGEKLLQIYQHISN